MSRPILLDTCALIWIANNDRLNDGAEAALQQMAAVAGGVVASPISAWKVGQLVSKGRVRLSADPLQWFQAIVDRGLTLAPMPAAVLVASSFLPDARLRDPADRILAATARFFDYRLMTRDRPLLTFAKAGHMLAIAC